MTSALHAITSIYTCYMGDACVIFPVSVGYYVQDTFNYPIRSIYVSHHFITVMALFYLFSEDSPHIIRGFMLCEISNLPVYYTYALMKCTKNLLHIACASLVEFMFFFVFRCIMMADMSELKSGVIGLAQIIYYSSVWWTVKLGIGAIRHIKKISW